MIASSRRPLLTIPEAQRAEIHLRIGRALLAGMTADELAEHLFDVANHFNRGATLLADRDEKAQVATIELRAGQKAKASTAYASANVYLVAGMALLEESDWAGPYDLMFSLWLERAECEYLTGQLASADARLSFAVNPRTDRRRFRRRHPPAHQSLYEPGPQ